MTTDCGFNKYYNGSECIPCQDGYYGNNCSTQCETGLYGQYCTLTCNCPEHQCNASIGCITDGTSSSQLSTSSYEQSVTNSFITSNFTNTPKIIATTGNLLSTSSSNSKVPVLTISNNPMNTNILIIAIGGLIALFLFVIITQWFVKLFLRRKKRAERISTNAETNPDEEEYEVINDSLLTVGTTKSSEHKKHKKYYELKNSSFVSTVPYQHIQTNSQYQEIDETCHSSNGSNSDNSNTSYLDPKTNVTVPHNYIEVLDSNTSKETTFIEESQQDFVNQNDNDPFTQYIDPVHEMNSQEHYNNSNDNNCGDNGAYLDVVHKNCL
uniref:Uncharacterized protein LOC111125923 isoform X3 n=1 Tax=Crassostrea virginica TaxID=6565 RepID=A0A8B8DDW4_CRAVI|nr:uncharacterized protein LOC111125923 isoform X3 [Crassostrea virginica]